MLVFCARDSKNSKFVLDGEFSMDTLQKFVEDFTAGKLEPYLKSKPVPQPNDGPVTVAVSKKFDGVVINNGKDTLIGFYAPWCSHCKNLASIFDNLSTKMKDEDVAVVKMATHRQQRAIDFRGAQFPHPLLAAQGLQEHGPQQYEGGRELHDFVKYLAKHSTSELKGWGRAEKVKKTESSERRGERSRWREESRHSTGLR